MKMLTLEDIIAAPDLTERVVEVPEWGGSVKVRGFSKGKQQMLRRDAVLPDGSMDTDKIEMLMFCLGVSEPEISPAMYEQLREKSAGAIDRVLKEILEVSGMSPDAMKNAEAAFPGRS